MRLTAFFTAVCSAIIAGACGAAAHAYLGLGRLHAAAVAAAIMIALTLLQATGGRIRRRSVLARQLADLSRGSADVARQVAEIHGRLAALEEKVDSALDHSRAVTDPLALEIEELGTLVKQLAETVANQQTVFDVISSDAAAAQGVPASAPAVAPGEAPHPSDTRGPDLDTIRDAVEADRIEIYLQPIVALPQRKVRFYEATARLRTLAGAIVHPSDFVPLAETSALMPKIDNRFMFRCIAAVRQLTRKNQDVGVFCSFSQRTLADADQFPQFLDFMAANRALASSLVPQFSQAAMRTMGAREYDTLAALIEHGFHFCMSDVTSLRLEPNKLARHGFRYVKMRADVLLNTARHAPGDIEPSELCDLLARFRIALIVDGIEDEGSIIELLDHDVRYGQGALFSLPRPVRADALQVADSPGTAPAEHDPPAGQDPDDEHSSA